MSKLFVAIFSCLFICVGHAKSANYTDILDEILGALKNGNSKEVSKHFSSSVNLTLLNTDGLYSKTQAEIILRDFFNKNTPVECKMVNRMESNPNFKFVVITLSTAKENFKVSCKIVSESTSFKISELKIERVE